MTQISNTVWLPPARQGLGLGPHLKLSRAELVLRSHVVERDFRKGIAAWKAGGSKVRLPCIRVWNVRFAGSSSSGETCRVCEQRALR
jgi:hypothetical protein